VPEVVINIVDYNMVQQVSLASCEYPKEINEFIKAGFTAEDSTLIRPPMVKESKVKLECLVKEIKPLGTEGGAGNLVICEVIFMHIDDSILDENNKIDQTKLHHIARLGGDWYAKIDSSNLFKVPKPNTQLGIGIDALPSAIKNSKHLSGNDLGMLANIHVMPENKFENLPQNIKSAIADCNFNEESIHKLAKNLLQKNQIEEAWQVLLSNG